MGSGLVLPPATPTRSSVEYPTWLALAACYAMWVSSVRFMPDLGWFLFVPAAIATAFHSSLTHEALHGHPTRNALVNEALVFPGLGLFIPYRRFRALHLKHHNDERLTDPFDDPESFYLCAGNWSSHCAIRRAILGFNGTFLGRMLVGPGLALFAFWHGEARLLARGDRAVWGAWLRHLAGIAPVLWFVADAGVPLWLYVFGVAYPGMSLIMVRSYIEHRAASNAAHRTAIVEGHWFWRLLFLNNNFHAVHHAQPALAWYRIPEVWQRERAAVLGRNGNYYLPGYGAVVRRWLLRRREPVIHPFFHPNDPTQ